MGDRILSPHMVHKCIQKFRLELINLLFEDESDHKISIELIKNRGLT